LYNNNGAYTLAQKNARGQGKDYTDKTTEGIFGGLKRYDNTKDIFGTGATNDQAPAKADDKAPAKAKDAPAKASLIQDDEEKAEDGEKASPHYTQDDSEEDAPDQDVDIQLRKFNE